MKYPKFDKLKITIITSQIPLSTEIDIQNLYISLNTDEEIECICYMGYIKGIKRTKKSKNKKMKEKFLKNHVSVHLYRNNINIKISKQKLALIGCRNIEDIEYCGKLITKKIRHINKMCEMYDSGFLYILNNLERLENRCKGRIVKNNITYEDDYMLKSSWVNKLGIDNNDFKHSLIYFSSLFKYSSQFSHFLTWSIHNDISVCEDDIRPLDFKISMINRMFNTGYNINLQSFYDIFSEIENYYTNEYRCEIHHKIYLKVLYDLSYKNKRRMVKCITFTIESSGSITISGPYNEVTKNEYKRFCENLIRNESLIKII